MTTAEAPSKADRIENIKRSISKMEMWFKRYSGELLTGNRGRQSRINEMKLWKMRCELAELEGKTPPTMPEHLRRPEELPTRVEILEGEVAELKAAVATLLEQSNSKSASSSRGAKG